MTTVIAKMITIMRGSW